MALPIIKNTMVLLFIRHTHLHHIKHLAHVLSRCLLLLMFLLFLFFSLNVCKVILLLLLFLLISLLRLILQYIRWHNVTLSLFDNHLLLQSLHQLVYFILVIVIRFSVDICMHMWLPLTLSVVMIISHRYWSSMSCWEYTLSTFIVTVVGVHCLVVVVIILIAWHFSCRFLTFYFTLIFIYFMSICERINK